MIREDFAGAGGWSEALRQLGRDALGYESDRDAVLTARSVGHRRALVDVRDVPIEPVEGYIASPPCQPLSEAAGDARALLERLLASADQVAAGRVPLADRLLSLWPLHVIRIARPEWVALEQVRTVQPLWDRYAVHLRSWGYSVATGIVRAELYGVPQTRSRSVLLASRLSSIELPEPTHRVPVSMAEALGFRPDGPWLLRSNYGNNGNPRSRGMRTMDQPAPTITGKATRMWWVRPDGSKIRNLSFREAAALQGFPPTYVWHGQANKRDDIIGNAVPVVLARKFLEPLAFFRDRD